MKRRVLGVLSVLVVALVLVVSTVVLSSAGRELTQELQLNRVASLNRIAQVAYDASTDGGTEVLQRDMNAYSEVYGEGLVVRTQQGTLSSGGLDPARPDVRRALDRASLNLSDTELTALTPFGSGTQVISRSFGTASQVMGEAVLEVNLDIAREKLRHRWLITGVASVVLVAVLLLSAARFTDWVLRPVRRVNAAARELQDTGHAPQLPEAGPPELRELSRTFTEMAASLSELIDSQRQLIADTSHHLRNPVGALRLRVDLLLSQLHEEKSTEAGAGVLMELDRVEEILDSVLKLAVAEHRMIEDAAVIASDSSEVSSDPVDVLMVVDDEIDRAQPTARAAGSLIRLVSHHDAGLVLTCNRVELAQMVGELLNNAIKYAPGAPITVSLGQRAAQLWIEIADNGPGLPAEQLTEVTTRFWRSPEHADIRGTGIGMTIVDKLARANGGRLRLLPNDPQGLRVRLEFATSTGRPEREDDA